MLVDQPRPLGRGDEAGFRLSRRRVPVGKISQGVREAVERVVAAGSAHGSRDSTNSNLARITSRNVWSKTLPMGVCFFQSELHK